VRIGTAVLVMPLRNPVLLARMLATLDVFSNGRIILGAGVGWMAEEFAVLDTFNFASRGQVTDEYLEIFKAICAGGEVSYHGETYQFEPIYSYPASVQRPHPPILVGGTSNPALRRVARLADGWLSVGLGLESLSERLGILRGMCEARGRSYDDLLLYHKLFINIGSRAPDRCRRSPTISNAFSIWAIAASSSATAARKPLSSNGKFPVSPPRSQQKFDSPIAHTNMAPSKGDLGRHRLRPSHCRPFRL
jgi:alkanesulfonate monooxygenase SsuD/methylene tetrahydromethanopterin reductase-like flavin-dependent oxidoreductase (luciferase family)